MGLIIQILPPPPSDYAGISPESWTFPSNGGTNQFSVTASGSWTASVVGSSFYLDKASGTGNDTITATAISGGAESSGEIVIRCGAAMATAALVRPASSCSIAEQFVHSVGGTKTIHVAANGDWSLSSSNSFFSIDPSSGSAGEDIEVSLESDQISFGSKTATIVLRCGSSSDQCGIIQLPPISSTPSSLSFVSSGETKQTEIDSGTAVEGGQGKWSWAATVEGDGFSISPSSGGGLVSTINVTADPNIGMGRTGKITVQRPYSDPIEIPLSQSQYASTWPDGVVGEKAYYGGSSFTFEYDGDGYWWYKNDNSQGVPLYCKYDYTTTNLWYNGMGELLNPQPTETP